MNQLRVLLAWILTVGNLAAVPAAVAASSEKEVQSYSKSMTEFFREFPDKPDRSTARYNGGYGGGSGNFSELNSGFYNRASQSNYTKAETLKSLSTLSGALAKTAGSALALDSAQKARKQATALKGSSDKDFQAVGKDMEELATAIESGDRVKAEQVSQRIASRPRPYVASNYKPTKGESGLVKALNLAIGGAIAAMGSVIGGLFASSLLKALGLSSGFLASEGKTLGRNMGTTTFNGGDTSKPLSNSAVRAVNRGGSDVNKAIQKSAPKEETLPRAGSGQTGSAPSAQ